MGEYKTGSVLLADLENEAIKPEPIAEGFLYRGTSNMLVGNPGEGKSTIALDIALSLSCRHPIFNSFPVLNEQKVYFLALEGSYYELIERIRMMRTKIPFNANNFCVDSTEILDAQSPRQVDLLIERM